MNTLQNMFKSQSSDKYTKMPLNSQQNNIVMQFMSMNEEQRAEKIAEILNQKGITKEQLQNIIKNFKK